jgi:hypothetical protein
MGDARGRLIIWRLIQPDILQILVFLLIKIDVLTPLTGWRPEQLPGSLAP